MSTVPTAEVASAGVATARVPAAEVSSTAKVSPTSPERVAAEMRSFGSPEASTAAKRVAAETGRFGGLVASAAITVRTSSPKGVESAAVRRCAGDARAPVGVSVVAVGVP